MGHGTQDVHLVYSLASPTLLATPPLLVPVLAALSLQPIGLLLSPWLSEHEPERPIECVSALEVAAASPFARASLSRANAGYDPRL